MEETLNPVEETIETPTEEVTETVTQEEAPAPEVE